MGEARSELVPGQVPEDFLYRASWVSLSCLPQGGRGSPTNARILTSGIVDPGKK